MLIVFTKEGAGAKEKKKNVVGHFRLSRAESRNMLKTSAFTQWFFFLNSVAHQPGLGSRGRGEGHFKRTWGRS